METLWLIIGFVGQGVFSLRFIVQWIVSERQKKSVVPVFFWYLSILGSLILLVYSIHQKDPVFILGQLFGSVIYFRNLFLIWEEKKKKVLEP